MDEKNCEKIINGYNCIIDINELNHFKNKYNLQYKKINEQHRVIVELFDTEGKIIATAIKYPNESKNYLHFITKKI